MWSLPPQWAVMTAVVALMDERSRLSKAGTRCTVPEFVQGFFIQRHDSAADKKKKKCTKKLMKSIETSSIQIQ